MLNKKEKIFLEYYNKKNNIKNLKIFFNKRLSKRDYKKIKDYLDKRKGKKIYDRDLKKILNIKKSVYELKRIDKNQKFSKKYGLKKYSKNFFEGKFFKIRNKILFQITDFERLLKSSFSRQTLKKIKEGKKVSFRTMRKIEVLIQNNLTMLDKYVLVKLIEMKLKNSRLRITNKLFNDMKKKFKNKIENLKKDLTPNKIERFNIYEFVY